MNETTAIRPAAGFLATVERLSGERVSRCYQCRKCTNGCPLSFAMDLLPNQVMRSVQLGLEDDVLRSQGIWVCASCQTCTTRCPNDIDIAHLMDTLRQMGRNSGVAAAEENIVHFHQAVLDSVRCHGRMFELGMVGRYKMASRDFFGGASLGLTMFRKGKLKLLPERIRGKREVRRMYSRKKKEG